MTHEKPFWNPYVGGVALGLVLLSTYVVMGWGLGSSSGPARAAFGIVHLLAPAYAEANGYMSSYVGDGIEVLEDWMVFEVIGVFLGGVIGAYSAGRMKRSHVDKGPLISARTRLFMAVFGGAIMGFAARLARGCTSGQALTGGALLSVGSWIFMLAVFAGAYATAPFIRRAWK